MSRETTRRRVVAALGPVISTIPIAGCLEGRLASSEDQLHPNSTERQGQSGSGKPSSDSWPEYGYGSRNSGYNQDGSGPESPVDVAWTFDGGTPSMSGSPVVGDGTVYIGGSGDPGGLTALDASTGEETWATPTDGYLASAPAISGDTVYVATTGGEVRAIDRRTGEQGWSVDVGHGFRGSSPVVLNGTVYVGSIGRKPDVVSGDGAGAQYESPALLALDADTGEESWRYDDVAPRDYIASSPASDGERVYCTCSDGNLYALSAGSGAVVWTRSIVGHAEPSPSIADGVVYYASPTKGTYREVGARLWALDATSGTDLWTSGIAESNIGSSPSIANGTVLLAAWSVTVSTSGESDSDDSATLYAVDASSGRKQWTTPVRARAHSGPGIAGEMIYLANGSGVSAVTLSGREVWHIDLAEHSAGSDLRLRSSPAVARGAVYVGCSDGTLYKIAKPEKYVIHS